MEISNEYKLYESITEHVHSLDRLAQLCANATPLQHSHFCKSPTYYLNIFLTNVDN